jgi:regulator of protease activity HflC (stomatin/prohibitin superfamily)
MMWLWDILKEFYYDLLFWVTINHYDRGVRLRVGKHIRPGIKVFRWRIGKLSGEVLKPGFHWKWPFADNILTIMVKPTTLDLTEQSLCTHDGIEVVIECSIKYSVSNPTILLLEVHSATDALADMSKEIIGATMSMYDYNEVRGELREQFKLQVLRKIRDEARKWGIRVSTFNIATLSRMRSIRLIQTSSTKQGESK